MSPPMKLIETTNPLANAATRTIWNDDTHRHEMELANHLRFHLLGMYFAETGPEWSSEGKRESDYLHHIDIPLKGTRQVVHEGKIMEIKPGWAYYLPGNTPVERRCSEPCHVLYFKFRCEWLRGIDPLLDRIGRAPTPIGRVNPDEWQSWRPAEQSISANQLFFLHAQIEVWMASILPDLETLVGQHIKSHSTFHAIFTQVEEQLGADLRVCTLAKTYGTGLRAFSKAFTADIGISPKEYINRRLNQEAIALLLNSNLKIKEVADRLHFANEFYFSRFFSKLNGTAPARYRQRFRNGG